MCAQIYAGSCDFRVCWSVKLRFKLRPSPSAFGGSALGADMVTAPGGGFERPRRPPAALSLAEAHIATDMHLQTRPWADKRALDKPSQAPFPPAN